MRSTNSLLRRSFAQCVRVRQHGGPEVMELCEMTPAELGRALQPDEVLVRNSYAGVNFIDTYYRSGLYRKPALPYVPGEEGAGAVLRVGSAVAAAGAVAVGQRVAYFGGGGGGSYAAFSVVPAAALRAVPAGVSDRDAAALLCQGLTAHYLVHDSYPCAPGSVVVVHAAAGGTGLLVCQLAKLRGATVIGVCGGAAKAALAARVGRCDHVVDYAATADWPAAVRALAGPRAAVDAVYDGVGQATFAGSLAVLRPRGYLITFGNASGPVPPVAPLDLMKAGSVYLQRPTLADFMRTKEEGDARAADLFRWLDEGKLQLTIGEVFALKDASKAHKALEGRKTTGKVLMDCGAVTGEAE